MACGVLQPLDGITEKLAKNKYAAVVHGPTDDRWRFQDLRFSLGAEAEEALKAMEAHADGPATFVAVASALTVLAQQATGVEVWSQHDPVGLGGFTGEPQTAMARCQQGIINHAEHKVELEHVRSLLEMLPDDFPVCACCRCGKPRPWLH